MKGQDKQDNGIKGKHMIKQHVTQTSTEQLANNFNQQQELKALSFIFHKQKIMKHNVAPIIQKIPQNLISKLQAFKESNKNPDHVDGFGFDQTQIKFIKQVNHQYFDIKSAFKSAWFQTMLWDICQINFSKVHTINISSVNINNIQALQFLSSESVITMQLYGNHITTLKPLAKNSQMKNLATLTFYFNPINEVNSLWKANMMKLSHFEYDGSTDCQTVQNLNPLMKNPCNTFTTLYIQSNKRIYQQKIINLLKKKNSKDQMYFPNLAQH